MAKAIRLLVADSKSGKFLERTYKHLGDMPFEITAPEEENEKELLLLAPEAEAILCYKVDLPGSVIRAATSLKFIQKHGINCKNIDLTAAREQGIPVGTIPLMRSASVAEQAMALMLACARKVVPGHQAVAEAAYQETGIEPMKTSQWEFNTNWTKIEGVTELFGASVGIVGMGDIGMDIANCCRAFHMEIFYTQRTPHTKDVEERLGATYLSLDELLARSDYVVLVIPHTPQTEGLIGPDQLSLMKSTATLINVGRGGLIDEDALHAALKNGKIGMAGLDVYRWEPLPNTSPLRELPNVVFTPHLGGGSYRSWGIDIPASLNNILRFFRGEALEGLVT
jgi:phosphoglycerate dehydrogenase-like enzyme